MACVGICSGVDRRYGDRQSEKPLFGSGSGIFEMTSANRVESGSIATSPLSAQNIGRMYSGASAGNFAMPSRASASTCCPVSVGFISRPSADRMTRWQCRSRSGATPSKARAPSKTALASHAALVADVMSGTSPSAH